VEAMHGRMTEYAATGEMTMNEEGILFELPIKGEGYMARY
jgi:hypothetical protein